MTNNRKSKIFTLDIILYIICKVILVISMLSSGSILKKYNETGEISYIIIGLVLLLIGNFCLNCEVSTFTKITKRKIYELLIRMVVSYVFLCLGIFACFLRSIFMGILALIAFIALGYIFYRQGFQG